MNQFPQTEAYYGNTQYYMRMCAHNCYTYLNRHLLGAPREYVLHGLNPGLN
jgi:hypothetical protein